MVKEKRLNSPFIEHLGIDVLLMKDGKAELLMELKPAMLNSGGMAHGGVLASLTDSAAGAAAFSVVADHSMAVTTDFNMTCLKSARNGLLSAKSELVHQGSRFIRADVEIRSDKDLLVKAGVSFMIIDRPTSP
jgi:acyl-CoA thioesterase